MDFVQSAFIRPDLWARPNLDQAYDIAEGAELQSRFRPVTRMQYGAAALKSGAQTVVLVAPALIFFVGHLITFAVNKVYENQASAWFRTKNQAYMGCFTGAAVTTLVALFSATLSSEIGSKIRKYSANSVGENWADFQTRIQSEFIQNIEKARQQRISGTIQNERFKTGSVIYRTCSGGIRRPTELFFDVLTEKKLARVYAHIQHVEKRMERLSDAEKQEMTEEAQQKIGDYVKKQTQKLGALPMTYVEMADYEVQQVKKFRAKATKFTSEEANRTATHYQMKYPGIFDRRQFSAKVNTFHQSMLRDLDQYITSVEHRSTQLKEEWDRRVGDLLDRQKKVTKAIQNQQWWLQYFGWNMNDQAKEEANRKLFEMNQELMQLGQSRFNVASQIQAGPFNCLLDARQSFDRRFCKYVDSNGWILKNIDKLARPWFYERWIHGLNGYVPSLGGWFDTSAS